MAAPYTFILSKEGDLDGLSPMAFGRADFSVTAGQVYRKSIEGPAGSIEDLIGLESSAPVNGSVIVDLAFVRVQPGDRLLGRYERGL